MQQIIISSEIEKHALRRTGNGLDWGSERGVEYVEIGRKDKNSDKENNINLDFSIGFSIGNRGKKEHNINYLTSTTYSDGGGGSLCSMFVHSDFTNKILKSESIGLSIGLSSSITLKKNFILCICICIYCCNIHYLTSTTTDIKRTTLTVDKKSEFVELLCTNILHKIPNINYLTLTT